MIIDIDRGYETATVDLGPARVYEARYDAHWDSEHREWTADLIVMRRGGQILLLHETGEDVGAIEDAIAAELNRREAP